MSRNDLNRRDFHKLSAAALGGLMSGAMIGCSEEGAKPAAKPAAAPPKSTTETEKSAAKGPAVAATSVALHACRGLNECKGQGKDKKNACAGQGDCYTVTHDCSGKNDCKLQGGCGGNDGLNDCKGKGGCGHFPISDKDTWKKAREAFEARMKQANKSVGAAPAPAKT